ncbi:hypothetical protein C8J57DRAFT_434654 [Mycena rebaudengoi]|nr:hypothetical protein C8J57DRAFT_434654 [Mycena rebaudengoi]
MPKPVLYASLVSRSVFALGGIFTTSDASALVRRKQTPSLRTTERMDFSGGRRICGGRVVSLSRPRGTSMYAPKREDDRCGQGDGIVEESIRLVATRPKFLRAVAASCCCGARARCSLPSTPCSRRVMLSITVLLAGMYLDSSASCPPLQVARLLHLRLWNPHPHTHAGFRICRLRRLAGVPPTLSAATPLSTETTVIPNRGAIVSLRARSATPRIWFPPRSRSPSEDCPQAISCHAMPPQSSSSYSDSASTADAQQGLAVPTGRLANDHRALLLLFLDVWLSIRLPRLRAVYVHGPIDLRSGLGY